MYRKNKNETERTEGINTTFFLAISTTLHMTWLLINLPFLSVKNVNVCGEFM